MFTHMTDQTANATNIEQLAENAIENIREAGIFTHTADETTNIGNI